MNSFIMHEINEKCIYFNTKFCRPNSTTWWINFENIAHWILFKNKNKKTKKQTKNKRKKKLKFVLKHFTEKELFAIGSAI